MTIAPSSYRRRVKRGSSVEGPPGFWGSMLERVSRSEVLLRLALCLAAGLLLLILMHGWQEPFPFREGMVPPRGIAARVPFEKPDAERTRAAQERAAAQVRVVYSHDKAAIVRLRDGLKNRLAEIAAADSLTASSRAAWLEFAPEAAAVIDKLTTPADKTGVQPPVAPEPPAAGDKPEEAASKTPSAQPDPAQPAAGDAAAAEKPAEKPAGRADKQVLDAEQAHKAQLVAVAERVREACAKVADSRGWQRASRIASPAPTSFEIPEN